MTVKLRIPRIKNRPLILFPPGGWGKGWLDESKPEPNAALSQKWSLKDWREFRELHFLDLVPSPFGHFVSDPALPHLLTPYSPWGLNKNRIPKLHPDDPNE